MHLPDRAGADPCSTSSGARGVAYAVGMEPTAITVVSQLITDARSRWGADAIRQIDVPPGLLDEAMDHVLDLGGRVEADGCTVEGVAVRELPDDADSPQAWVEGDDTPRPLTSQGA